MFIMENECNRNYEFKKILNDEIHVIPTVFYKFLGLFFVLEFQFLEF